jgi:hypothetical protein
VAIVRQVLSQVVKIAEIAVVEIAEDAVEIAEDAVVIAEAVAVELAQVVEIAVVVAANNKALVK